MERDQALRILLVEDSAPTRDLLSRYLAEAGMTTTCASRMSTGLEQAQAGDYDVIVLDLMLPDGDGLALCRELRAAGNTTPVLCLTARAEVADRVEGLDSGADDYLKKPFALAELQARIRALARRRGTPAPRILEANGTRIDFTSRRLQHSGIEVPLTEREWRLLELLAARGGRVIGRAEILDTLWPGAGRAGSDSLDVILSRLRRKLGSGRGFAIRTVRGEGLVFERSS